MKSYVLALATGLALAMSLLAQEAPKLQLTARELFYSAAQATPPAPPAPPAPKPAATKKKAPTHVASRSKPAPVSAAAASSVSTSMQPRANSTDQSDTARIIPVSADMTSTPSASAPALGMRYTILRRTGGEMLEVAPDTVFHSGDRIQFNVETNGPGYLYIVTQGSSGTWKPMFPSADVDDGNNRVDGFHAYAMPPKSRLVFDELAGTEKIFIVFSRQPEPNLENTIYSLQAPKAKPASKPEVQPQPQSKQLLVASIDDGVVGRLRNSYSRDLIIEKVDESTSGDKKEKAVYVVNPSGSQDSRVVADLHLVHK